MGVPITEQDRYVIRLEAELQDWQDCADTAAKGGHPDERHCACVPLLRKDRDRLAELLKRMMLYALTPEAEAVNLELVAEVRKALAGGETTTNRTD